MAPIPEMGVGAIEGTARIKFDSPLDLEAGGPESSSGDSAIDADEPPIKGDSGPSLVPKEEPPAAEQPQRAARDSSLCPWNEKSIFKDGRWTWQKGARAPYATHESAQGGDTICNNSAVRKGGRYEWNVPGCTLESTSREAMCKALNGRSLLFVGDSLLFQTAVAAYEVLNGTLEKGYTHFCEIPMPRATPCLCEYTACGGKVRVAYIRNDFLTIGGRFDDEFIDPETPVCHLGDCPWGDKRPPWPYRTQAGDHLFKWHDRVFDYDIVFLSTSGHWTPKRVKGRDLIGKFRRHMFEVAKLLAPHKGVIVWKGQSHGHRDCDSAREPLEKLPVTYLGEFQHWSWNLFQDMHNIGRDQLACRIPENRFIALDPVVLNYRADRHKLGDCLHYCLPGPSDVWLQLLQNALRARAETPGPLEPAKTCGSERHIGIYNKLRGNKPVTSYRLKF